MSGVERHANMCATWQVHPNGIRHVRSDGRQNEWKTPRGRPIKHATANARQVAISLEGDEMISTLTYFLLYLYLLTAGGDLARGGRGDLL